MKRTETILNQLSKNVTHLELEIIKLLTTLIAYNHGNAVNVTMFKLNNSFISLIEQELLEFKESFTMTLDAYVTPKFNNVLKLYLNSLYEYNYDFYLTDYKDAFKMIDNILNKSEDTYYLESNLYTLIASYLRMFILYKIASNLTDSNIDNYTKAFYFSKYKTIVTNKLNSLTKDLNNDSN